MPNWYILATVRIELAHTRQHKTTTPHIHYSITIRSWQTYTHHQHGIRTGTNTPYSIELTYTFQCENEIGIYTNKQEWMHMLWNIHSNIQSKLVRACQRKIEPNKKKKKERERQNIEKKRKHKEKTNSICQIKLYARSICVDFIFCRIDVDHQKG